MLEHGAFSRSNSVTITNPSSQIVLPDPCISNIHLLIDSVIWESPDEPRRVFVYAEDLSTNGSYWLSQSEAKFLHHRIEKGRAVLLSDGDMVKLCNGVVLTFEAAECTSTSPQEKCASHAKDAEIKVCDYSFTEVKLIIQAFDNLYTITDRTLGTGSFGEVRMAIDRMQRRQVACKIVPLEGELLQRRGKNIAEKLWREVEILKDMIHVGLYLTCRAFL